jgi:Putative Flp pilus-assembly TadE/G-like
MIALAAKASNLATARMRRPLARVARASAAPTKRSAAFAAAFLSDTSGIILPYVTLMLIAIVGMAVLALDGARYMSLQTQLQNGADALALAGAAELDRLPDSEDRAVRAIRTLVANSTLFGAGPSRNVQVADIRFFSEIPATDDAPESEGALAADPTHARFVSVRVKPVSLATILPAGLFGGSNTITTGASAVAGFDQVVCQFTPLFVCNPHETDGMTYEGATATLQAAIADPTIRRRLIRLHQYRGANEYAAGDYGFLDAPSLGRDEAALIDALAKVRPTACFLQSHVNFRPGFVAAARQAFNVRFDIYEGAMSVNKNDVDYRPAANVRKGYIGGSCSAVPANNWPIGSPPNQATGLPLDRTWPYLGGRMGAGIWDFATYWQVNHSGDGRSPPMADGAPASNANPPSRYQVYRYEIEQGFVADRSPGGESGAPACYAGDGLPGAPDRRILYAALINCRSLGLNRGARWNIPVAAFGKLFLTLPLSRSQTDLYVELVDLVKPGDHVNLDLVQLYR